MYLLLQFVLKFWLIQLFQFFGIFQFLWNLGCLRLILIFSLSCLTPDTPTAKHQLQPYHTPHHTPHHTPVNPSVTPPSHSITSPVTALSHFYHKHPQILSHSSELEKAWQIALTQFLGLKYQHKKACKNTHKCAKMSKKMQRIAKMCKMCKNTTKLCKEFVKIQKISTAGKS